MIFLYFFCFLHYILNSNIFFFSSRRRHTRSTRDWSSDVCSSDLGIGSAMLGELERRLVAAGVHRIQCLLAGEAESGALALEHAGYTARPGVVFYERLEPVRPGSAGVLGQLGGRMVRAGAWDQLGGMVKEKELIERRVILPLAQPQLAGRLGLVPPRAIV